jgi:hypothetical protein
MSETISALQGHFADALTWRQDAIPNEITARNSSTPTKRFNVYRNNVFVSLTEAIRGKFPVVERLLGTEFAGAMARVFVEDNLPTSPVMLEYGAHYPTFLKTFEPVAHHPYLPDLAQLEWLRIESYHARDASPLAITELAKIAPEHLADVRFILHPSVRIIASSYPIISIWQTNTLDDEVKAIDVSTGGEAALIVRPEFDVLVMPLDTGQHAFVSALYDGQTLNDAAAHAHDIFDQFSLDEALITLFQVGAVSDLNLSSSKHSQGTQHDTQSD